MEIVLEKISSYNIFNYIIPGGILSSFIDYLFPEISISENVVTLLIYYYFVGMLVSRVGSLLIEPLLLKIKFIVYAPYGDFVVAASTDKKLELLVEVNNSYRTFAAMALIMGIIYVVYIYKDILYNYIQIFCVFGIVLIFLCFIFAYKKQTSFLKIRVENDLAPKN